MKLLADENIPYSVVSKLADGGYDILWIRTESPGISDIDVMKFACVEKRIILTYDKDFGELAVKDNLCPSAGQTLSASFLGVIGNLAAIGGFSGHGPVLW